ncbi:MAG: hypothetical protein QME62_01625 [Armatimonadota bacterium]|nr:hypothetical protein [Armatimonadota bacterium]
MTVIVRQNRIMRLAERIHNLCRPGKVYALETNVGLKCLFGRFSSDRLNEYVFDEMPFSSTSLELSDLLLSTDFLRDRYTLCGVDLLQSPHFRLMQEMATGTLTHESEYVLRCQSGTLDSRLPFDPDLSQLRKYYNLRLEELKERKRFYIYVRQVTLNGRIVCLIADGKHRAALAAYLERTKCLYLRYVSSEVNNEPFFRQVFDRVLTLDPQEYSINQMMIRAIQHEPTVA